MKLLLLLSAFTCISSIRVPSIWNQQQQEQQQDNDANLNAVNRNPQPIRQDETVVQTVVPTYNNINGFWNPQQQQQQQQQQDNNANLNGANRDLRPIRQDETPVQPVPTYNSINGFLNHQHQQPQQQDNNANLNGVNRNHQPLREGEAPIQPIPTYNSINGFVNNLPTTASAGLIANGNIFSNIPINYNNWFTGGAPNNGFTFVSPTSQLSNGNLLNNNVNSNANNRNGVRGRAYLQQVPPRLVPNARINNRRPAAPSSNPQSGPYKEIPGHVPYITYTTHGPGAETTAFSTLQPVQNSEQVVNIKQAYPQVSGPKTLSPLPLTELDFSPKNPFPNEEQGVQASTQINKQNPNTRFSTAQPINNLDFTISNPFPSANGYHVPQISRVPVYKPLFNGNPTTGLRNLNFNPFTKNYRDHRTHEPTQFEPHYDREPVPIVERLESEKAPIVKNHEHPAEVPTGPIYTGEGQWAKPGVKHRPFISKQQYVNLEDSNEKPDGYDTFLEGQKLFENQKAQYGQKLTQYPTNDVSTRQSSTEEADTETFVPTRLYAQVRHSEDEKHLPPESDENGRLKELIKDTKIQTIYSEEGYEDSAYDHAGHEKKAENHEDFESDEKNEENKEKKRIPLKKYDRQSASYSIGDQNLKEEDIEKNKKEELNLGNGKEEKVDSEPAGTHYGELSYFNKIKPSKIKDGNKKAGSNAFIKSKETKTVTATDKGGGKIEMEISSEVKAVVQPNNSTKFHKYIKIYPKMNKNITGKEIKYEGTQIPLVAEKRSLTLNPHQLSIDEVNNGPNTKYVTTTVTPTEYAEIVTVEIPTTTLGTTAIPRLEANGVNLRRRRSAHGIPKIEVDTDFIDEINHDLGKPKKANVQKENKYPYYRTYKEKGLHEDSPLRYAEDIKNVPVKSEGNLAFYDLADKKISCPDVNPEVNPVPDRIQNADEGVEEEEEDEEGNDPATKEPRLGQLGDKIDCFKLKYFGENPLDNPIFQEKTVGTVKPIFAEIEKISTKKIGSNEAANSRSIKRELKQPIEITQLHAEASNHDTENEIDGKAPHKHKLTSWFPGKNFGMGENTERDSKFVNHFVDKNPNLKTNNNADEVKPQHTKASAKEVQTLPPATLITTPKYTISLKPKHIYDQIQLLEYLPDEELEEVRKELNADLPKINITEITTSSPNINKTETVLNAPIVKKKKKGNKKSKAAERKARILKNIDENMKMETSDNLRPESLPETEALQLIRPKQRKPMYEIFDINKFLPKVPKISLPAERRVSTENPYLAAVSIRNPTYQIFDINKYLPTTPFPIFNNFITRSTVLPKFKVISEVFYKEDIKPNEQLTVLTDIINNIKSFPRLKDHFPQSSQSVSVKVNAEEALEKHPQNFNKDVDVENKDYYSSTITTVTATFDPKKYASNHKYVQLEDQDNTGKYIDSMLNDHKTGSKPKRRRRIKTTTQETPMVIEESTSTLQYIGEPTEVMGLLPPVIQGYKTIYHPKRDSSQQISGPTIRIEERKINRYFVHGMKPPPKQKVYLYSDFLTDNHIAQRMSKPKRSKRSAQRPAYAQVSRNRNRNPEPQPEAKKEEEDDYVPHRQRNYHYDEKTGKIVYDKKPKEQKEEEEEVEYVEVVEETPTPKTTAKPKQSPIFATATPPPAGQSYTDFVNLLKSASNYIEIPDPTTTEKGAEEATQKMAASTLQPVSTTPPEFLSILAKVRNDTTYKLIEDKKKTTTSAPAEEEAENAEEETQVEDVKNSPGGQGYEAVTNLEIFDITDFLPNIKSYLPKTPVDTSKYKTIERPQLRHSLSSRYNSEEEKNLRNVNTNKEPILPSGEGSGKALTRGALRPQIREPVAQPLEQTSVNPITATTTTTPVPEVTTQKVIRIARRRTTTARSVASQDEVSTTEASATNQEAEVVHHDKARRNYRRRPKRIRVKPTTEDNSEQSTDSTTKIVRRRSERDSHMYAGSNQQYEVVDADITSQAPPNDDYVDYEEISDNLNNTEVKQNISSVAKKVVDIFKNYDKNQKHGGNYRKEDEVDKSNLQGEAVNQGKVKGAVGAFKEYDTTKKHGGNYRAENDDTRNSKEVITAAVTKLEPMDIKKIDVFKNYDKTKKHGGNYRAEGVTVLKKIDPKVIKNVEIFKDYDRTKQHGGNYRPENDDTIINGKDESGLAKPESIQVKNVNVFQGNEKLKAIEPEPILLKNVEIFKDYDKVKKHGGNYRAELNAPLQEQQLGESQFGSPQPIQNVHNDKDVKRSSVEVFKNYDQTKKHGGNYIRENERAKIASKEDIPTDKAEDVDVFKTYDEEKETGGNYRKETNAPIQEQQPGESQFSSPQLIQSIHNENGGKRKSVEVFKNYDQTKKHGGNYIRENENEKIVSKEDTPADKVKDVDIFKTYDEEKRTGGNYKSEEEPTEPNVDETHYSKTKTPQHKRFIESRNNIQRLADVVLKPEAFYSDINLPLDINALKIVKNLSHEELEDIVDSAVVTDDDKTKEEDISRKDTASVVTISNKVKVPPTEAPVVTTKKPLFIKDPSKRLYFYAPI